MVMHVIKNYGARYLEARLYVATAPLHLVRWIQKYTLSGVFRIAIVNTLTVSYIEQDYAMNAKYAWSLRGGGGVIDRLKPPPPLDLS